MSVEFLVGLKAEGWTDDAIPKSYPGIEGADLLACWASARQRLQAERVFPLPRAS